MFEILGNLPYLIVLVFVIIILIHKRNNPNLEHNTTGHEAGPSNYSQRNDWHNITYRSKSFRGLVKEYIYWEK